MTAVREFVVARNPEEGSSLPYLVRLPLPDGAVVMNLDPPFGLGRSPWRPGNAQLGGVSADLGVDG